MIPNRVKPRKAQVNAVNKFTSDPELDAFQNLAAAIVVQAKQDAKRLAGRERAYMENEWITKSELIRFFESAWCQMLLGMPDMDSKRLREKVGI